MKFQRRHKGCCGVGTGRERKASENTKDTTQKQPLEAPGSSRCTWSNIVSNNSSADRHRPEPKEGRL